MNKKYITSGILIILALVSVYLAHLFISNLGFKIASISPSLNKMPTSTPFIDVSFNKVPSQINIKATPDIVVKQTVIGKKLRIFIKSPLVAGYKYKIVFSAKTSGGLSISDYPLEFTPAQISFDKLPKEQQKFLVSEQDKAFQDPILQHLPYGTLDFSLVPENTNGDLIINARLLLTHADSNSGQTVKNQAIDTYKKEVTNYIKSLGLDPGKYKINYTAVEQP